MGQKQGFFNSLKNLVIKLLKKTLWPRFMDGVQLLQS